MELSFNWQNHFHLISSSMHFRNNEMGKVCSQDMKPTPFPRTTASNHLLASAPSFNALNNNCHELVNDGFNSASSRLQSNATEVHGFSDDEGEEMNADYSTDPHQRLIMWTLLFIPPPLSLFRCLIRLIDSAVIISLIKLASLGRKLVNKITSRTSPGWDFPVSQLESLINSRT